MIARLRIGHARGSTFPNRFIQGMMDTLRAGQPSPRCQRGGWPAPDTSTFRQSDGRHSWQRSARASSVGGRRKRITGSDRLRAEVSDGSPV